MTASWVIITKRDNQAAFETFSQRLVDSLNPEHYYAVPIRDYLVNINQSIKAGATGTVAFNPDLPPEA